jgi:hypothetical protein
VRAWWLRTLLVLAAPGAVFVALRDDTSEDTAERAEPVLLIVWLSGIAFVLATRTTSHLMDQADAPHGIVVAVWAFLAGGLFGGVAYWLVGWVLYRIGLALGSQGSYRRARHVLAFAAVPVALSLVLWPFKLALFGDAVFHRGGTDAGRGGTVFEALLVAFLVWSACLLLVGVRSVHGWTWARAAAATAAPVVIAAAFVLV